MIYHTYDPFKLDAFYLQKMSQTKINPWNPFDHGICALTVQLYVMCNTYPNKVFWTIDEIYTVRYPNSDHDKSQTLSILRTNLKWLRSRGALEYRNDKSIRLIKYRLSSLINELC